MEMGFSMDHDMTSDMDQVMHMLMRHMCQLTRVLRVPPCAMFSIPSWTDRILYRPSDGIHQLAYDACTDIKTSDHRPVWATFHVRIECDPNQPEV